MDLFITRRGGGNSLNVKVIGGTTEPENPKENTIWVNTDHEITSWIITPSVPAEVVDGMIWIQWHSKNGTELNAFVDGIFTVYLIDVKQYIDGVWVTCSANIFTSGEWRIIKGNHLLYNVGDQMIDLTGGWGELYGASDGVLTFHDTYMYMARSSIDYHTVCTVKAIDTTGYTTLNSEVDIISTDGTYGNARLGYAAARPSSTSNTTGDASTVIGNSTGSYKTSIDISGVTTPIYVMFRSTGNYVAHVKRVWLE